MVYFFVVNVEEITVSWKEIRNFFGMTEKKHTAYWIRIKNSLRVSSPHPPTQVIYYLFSICPSANCHISWSSSAVKILHWSEARLLLIFLPPAFFDSITYAKWSADAYVMLHFVFSQKSYEGINEHLMDTISARSTQIWEFAHLSHWGLICLPRLIFCSFMHYAKSKSLLLKAKFNTDFSLRHQRQLMLIM